MPPRHTDDGLGAGSHQTVADASSSDMPSPRPLTARELEVLIQVARGRTNRMVGEALGLSERTVRNHLRSISKKLSTSDRTHAVVQAIERGWIAIPIVPDDEGEPGSDGEWAIESGTRRSAR